MSEYVWRIREDRFVQLRDKKKRIEVRVGYSNIKKIQKGDFIMFEGYDHNKFEIVRIVRYLSFDDMLEAEGVRNVFPGMTVTEALSMLRDIYPKRGEMLGVYAFELRPIGDDVVLTQKYYNASELLGAGRFKAFSKIVAEAYMMTDWVNKRNPGYCGRFYGEYIPGILCGEYELISCYIDDRIAGVSILKKNSDGNGFNMSHIKSDCKIKDEIALELSKRTAAFGVDILATAIK